MASRSDVRPKKISPVVGGDSNGKHVAGRKGKDRVARNELCTRSIKRYLGTRNIGDHQVVLFTHHFGGCAYTERVQT